MYTDYKLQSMVNEIDPDNSYMLILTMIVGIILKENLME